MDIIKGSKGSLIAKNGDTFAKVNEKHKSYPVPARIKRVVSIILKHNPDVVTLQEVDQYWEFAEVLSKFGYEGCWNQKKKSPASAYNGKDGENDCAAVFYKTTRLTFVALHRLSLPDWDKETWTPI